MVEITILTSPSVPGTENEIVHISTTTCAMNKLFTPICSPRDDHQKNSGLLIAETCLKIALF